MTLPPRLLALLLLPAIICLAVFFVLPLSVLVAETGAEGGVAYLRLVDDPVFWQGLRGTLILGTAAPALSVAVGFCVAMHLARQPEGRRQALLFVLSLPLTFSGLIVAYGFILVFGRAGFFTLLLAELGADPAVVGAMIFTPAGLGFAYCYYLIPRVVLVVLPVLVNFDSRQIDAAESLGASRFAAFRDVLLPQVAPALVAAFCLTAAVAIGAYGTALALVGTQVNILPLLLFSKISETGADLPAAAAASVVLMAVCCAVVGLAEALMGLRRRSDGVR
ncbi:ABC transporter permease subunit [Tistrella bauzanensis]|jgi:putative spermidine/putrescine transport system permease protein|uniref:ABC transporter permease n=1 Tax=Tistrella TaxID=171436 RepID=UPI0031F67E9D